MYRCESWTIKKAESENRSVVSDSLQPHGLYSQWSSPGQNTRVGNYSLLQGIFPTQGSNPDLLHYRRILCQLSHKGNPRILEWVAYPFSSRSSQPRNQTGVSCIVGGFFTSWAMRKALKQNTYSSRSSRIGKVWEIVIPKSSLGSRDNFNVTP